MLPHIGSRIALSVLTASMCLAGCTRETSDVDAALGKSLDGVPHAVGARFEDLSPAVAHEAATFDGPLLFTEPDRWVVVGACRARQADGRARLTLGVIPQRLATAAIVQRARSGEFTPRMRHCGAQ